MNEKVLFSVPEKWDGWAGNIEPYKGTGVCQFCYQNRACWKRRATNNERLFSCDDCKSKLGA